MKKLCSLILSVLLVISCFGYTATAEATPDEQVTVIYEAFFLDNKEISGLFVEVRGEDAPYALVTNDFHITTRFLPEQDMRSFYGTEVTVHIYAYQTGEIIADDGSTTANEGFFCTITTDDPELQYFIDHLEKNWHITGSYQDQGGAKYTEHLDLTGAQAVEYTVTGHLGSYLSNGSIVFSPEDALSE